MKIPTLKSEEPKIGAVFVADIDGDDLDLESLAQEPFGCLHPPQTKLGRRRGTVAFAKSRSNWRGEQPSAPAKRATRYSACFARSSQCSMSAKLLAIKSF